MDYISYIVIPFLIFVARILDVSLGTIRFIFISRGFKKIAPVLGFIEVLIWLVAIRYIMLNLTNFMAYIGYAAGFATGTYVGMHLEEKISMGKVMVNIITKKKAKELVAALKKTRHVVTAVDGKGMKGNVKVIFMFVKRHDVPKILAITREYNPHSFYSVEDVRYCADERIPLPKPKRHVVSARKSK